MGRKNKNKKIIYECEICHNTDSEEPVVACDLCDKWHHFDCVGITTIGKKDSWVCDKCKETKSFTNSHRDSHQSTKQPSVVSHRDSHQSTKQSTVVSHRDSHQSTKQPTVVSHRDSHQSTKQSLVVSNRNLNQSLASRSTRISSQRQRIELEIIEEERILREKRDAEYLEKKYRVLLQRVEQSDKREDTSYISEHPNYTKNWIEQQRFNSPPATITEIDERERKSDCHLSQKLTFETNPTWQFSQEKQVDLQRCDFCHMVGDGIKFKKCLTWAKIGHIICLDIIWIDNETRWICKDCKKPEIHSIKTQPKKEENGSNQGSKDELLCTICDKKNNHKSFKPCDVCDKEFHFECMDITSIDKQILWVCKDCKGHNTHSKHVAENLLFRQAQFQDFTEEMVLLLRNQQLSKHQQKYVQRSSPLYKLSPYLDENGLIRHHGRIDSANDVSFSMKRPIILPRGNRITQLLVANYHRSYHHRNHRTVYNAIRQRFYIPCLRVVLNSIRNTCQRCKNKRAKPQPPEMADLPPARLAIGFKAFTYIGIDYFGPMYITIGRRNEKRWGVLITCLTVRAVHIELAYKLDTESCIMCIRNFANLRGAPQEIYSDQGSNMKGMDNELKKLVQDIDVVKMASDLTTCYTKWCFNPPHSPHMGGAWERMVGSVKTCLYDIMPTRHPTEDMLRNLLLEVSNIVNSRPLTYVPLEHDDDDILTPNHFIIGIPNNLQPMIEIDCDGPILRSKWMENQRLADKFWIKFVKEFLPELTRRTKWFERVEPIKVDDIVLLVDETNIRGQYPKCRVIETYTGSNDQVRRAKILRINNEGSRLQRSILVRPVVSLAKLDVHIPEVGLSVTPVDRQTEGSVMNDGNTAAIMTPLDEAN